MIYKLTALLGRTSNTELSTSRFRIKVEILFIGALILSLLPDFRHYSDFEYWKSWALYIHEQGLQNIYKSDANYPPVLMYLLYIYDCWQGTSEKIVANINHLKIIPFLFDFLPIIILFKLKRWVQIEKRYHFFLLFNIGYLYNSVIWGQVDSIHSNLVLLALVLALRFPVWSVAVFVMAINMKVQSVVFVPVFILCLASKINSFSQMLKCIGLALVTQAVVLAPFIATGTVDRFWNMVVSSVGYWPKISMNAFNIWHLLIDGDTMAMDDQEMFYFLSYKTWGMILFFVISAVTLIPLLLSTLTTIRKKKLNRKSMELIFLTSGIIALVFFYFNTEMHERYSHPAMILFFFYGLYSGRLDLFIFTSIAYFLNMEKVLRYYSIAHHTVLFDSRFIALLFLLVISTGIYRLYSKYLFLPARLS